MNADTGHVRELPILSTVSGESWWPPVGEPVTASDLPTDTTHLSAEDREAVEQLREDVYAEQPIVMVSAAVAHAQRVGQRELGRRARRRRPPREVG